MALVYRLVLVCVPLLPPARFSFGFPDTASSWAIYLIYLAFFNKANYSGSLYVRLAIFATNRFRPLLVSSIIISSVGAWDWETCRQFLLGFAYADKKKSGQNY